MGCFSNGLSNVMMTDKMMAERHQFITDLFRGKMPKEELLRSSEQKLGLKFEWPYYSVAIISHEDIVNDFGNNSLSSLLPRIVDAYLSGKSIRSYCYMEDTFTFRCLINHRDQDLSQELLPTLRKLRSNYLQHSRYNLIAGVGTPVTSLQDVSTSYGEALRAINCQVATGAFGITFYKDLLRFSGPQETENELLDRLMAEFQKNNLSEIRLSIERHVRNLTIRRLDGLDCCFSFYIRYLTRLSRVAMHVGYSIDEIDRMGISPEVIVQLRNPPLELAYVLDKTQFLLAKVFGVSDSSNYQITRAKVYVTEQLGNPNLDLESVSAYVGLSRTYLCKLFYKSEGVHFNDYIKNMRIAKAKEMLIGTNMKIFEISDALGFNNAKYFGHVFKAETGFTPADFRNNYL